MTLFLYDITCLLYTSKLSEGGQPEDAINCVIMSPTRELAQQIDQQMEGFSYFMPASSVAVYLSLIHI